MGKRAVLIIKKDKSILLIHRFNDGREYFVLPGGSVEMNETIQQAAIREAKEETSLDIEIDKLLWEYQDDFDGRINYFFLVTEFMGFPKLSGPEAERNSEKDKYILEWHEISKIKNLLLYPEEIKEKIIKELG